MKPESPRPQNSRSPAAAWRTEREPTTSARSLRSGMIPDAVRGLLDRLREAGGQAFVVGGPVRDLILGRPVRDWDIATDLTPDLVCGLFSHTVRVGAAFGTVVVVEAGASYEVTTFRADGAYSDGRHPDSVTYSTRLEDDLRRRDFTVNAMAFDPQTEILVDLFCGLDDLEARQLRTVGPADERFGEDALRLLRAVRLACQLEFDLEAQTYAALVRGAAAIERISAERVRDELVRIMACPRPAEAFDLLFETGLLERILPELAQCYGVAQNPHHAYDVFHHTLAAIDAADPARPVIRLAALFHDVGKPETRAETSETATFYGHQFTSEDHAHAALTRLRFPNRERDSVAHLVRHHMFHYNEEWSDGAVRRFLRTVGADEVENLFALRAADTFGNGLRTRLAPELAQLNARIEAILAADNALGLKDLAVNGRDLMDALGVPPGPALGRTLDALLQHVLEHPDDNERARLLELARAWAGEDTSAPDP